MSKNQLHQLSSAMKNGSDENLVEELFSFMQTLGQGSYGEPDVTQAQHALQSAALAKDMDLSNAEITAALFHDIGHLVDDSIPEDEFQDFDRFHELIGSKLLSRRFGENVTEPVRLHVNAKRYLCAADADYHDTLSDASKISLGLQGGPYSAQEAEEFEANRYHKSAVAIRRIDDLAKVPNLETPGFEAYREVVLAALPGEST